MILLRTRLYDDVVSQLYHLCNLEQKDDKKFSIKFWMIIKIMILRTVFLLGLILLVSSTSSVDYTSCSESASRSCVYGTNVTDRLLNMKKGGSNVLSTNNYDASFFPCEEYNFNCGYLEESTDFLTVSNGVQLNLTYSELLNCVPSDPTLTNTVKPYLGLSPSTAICVSNVFPLQLTDSQSVALLNGYLNRLVSNLSTIYNANRINSAPSWSNLNINIKTAVLEMAKYNMNVNFLAGSFWNNFLFNNWPAMSNELKSNNVNNSCPQCLHSAYLIDSVTTRCNKYQSISFLVDESGSIGSSAFQYAKSFLYTYVNQTYDDLSIMSIHFFDGSFDPYIYYGNNRATILSMIQSKSYRGGYTNTGLAINASVQLIRNANFPNGVPKILVILTDGGSQDAVLNAANYARANGIILFCVGIGANVNSTQLLQIAGSTSNIVYISSYASLDKLVSLIQNYFCKQIIDVNLNDFIYGNVVRVPSSPSYFRVARSTNTSQYYKLSIFYKNDPAIAGQVARESHFDPFPDDFSQFAKTQNYRTGVLTKQYYISPQAAQDIPLKKNLTVSQVPSRAFISFAGNNLNFNISLTACATINCTTERTAAASIGSLSSDNFQGGEEGDGNNNANIWLAIGLGVGLMGVTTAGAIYGLRKFIGDPPEEAIRLQEGQTIEKGPEDVHHHKHQRDEHRDGDESKSDEDSRSASGSSKKSSKSVRR